MENLTHRNYYSDAKIALYFDVRNTVKKVMENYKKISFKEKNCMILN